MLGEDHAYPMVSFNTMKKSAAWKLYAKSQGVPFELANTVSEQLKKYEKALKHADEDEKEKIVETNYVSRQYWDIYEKSKSYLGLICSWSIAPCSYLLYQGSIRKEIGLVRINDHICCALDGHVAESNHFLKNDLLKVSVVDCIYRMFKSIGMEPPSVNELLDMCDPEDEAWSIYEKGCCLGINQVEREGTSARVSKYKPKNISELAAFVAAIRPGSASIYKTFEAREPFSYGIKAFDDLLQTPEMPNSFILYQEQEMNVLHYAGISMAETYGAIKNIAKKRVEKVLAYKEKFINGFRQSIIDEGKTQEEADSLSNELWGLIEDSASYSFNASHSYCVALDSLYCAWFKAHYPLKFYEQYIRIQEEKGDKDKINMAKEEAESYFGIRFMPLKFGQDNRTIHADNDNNSLINTIGSVKGYGATIGKELYNCSLQNFSSFIDVLRWLDGRGVKEGKFKPLILIDYFSQFGNQRKLCRIADLWSFFKEGTVKSIKRSSVENNKNLYEIIQKYTNGLRKDGKDAASLTFETQEDVYKCLKECENLINRYNYEDIDLKVKIQNSIDILGYVDVITHKPEDQRKLIIMDITPLTDKKNGQIWSYRCGTRSVGTGKTARVSITPKQFSRDEIKAGDIVFCKEINKNKAGYWYMTEYYKDF